MAEKEDRALLLRKAGSARKHARRAGKARPRRPGNRVMARVILFLEQQEHPDTRRLARLHSGVWER